MSKKFVFVFLLIFNFTIYLNSTEISESPEVTWHTSEIPSVMSPVSETETQLASQLEQKSSNEPKSNNHILEKFNRLFADIKKEILNMSFDNQFYLALYLLNALGYEISLNNIPKMNDVLNKINEFINIVIAEEKKPLNDFLNYINSKSPEKAGKLMEKYMIAISNTVNIQKKNIRRIRYSGYISFYNIIYDNLKNKAENLPAELVVKISHIFKNGMMPSPDQLRKIYKY